MKLTIIKVWLTEEEIDVPEGMPPAQIQEWINDNVVDWADALDPNRPPLQWQGTEVRDENDILFFEAST